MTTAVKSLGSGAFDSFNALVEQAPIIAVGVVVSSAVGFLSGGSAVAWLAAKVAGMVLGILYSLGRPEFVIERDILSAKNCNAVGRVVGSIGIPYVFIRAIELLVV